MSGASVDHAPLTLTRARRDIRGCTRMSPSGRAFGATPLAHAGYYLIRSRMLT
jgi:hypothetical protein